MNTYTHRLFFAILSGTLFFIGLLLFSTAPVSAATAGIPQIAITTTNGNGNGLLKSTGYVPAQITITDAHGRQALSAAAAEIKVRGNSTSALPKKPYTIRFEEKQDILGMGSFRKWVLLANQMDASLLRNACAFSMAQYLELPYTSDFLFVEVTMDGKFLGNYLLTEPVEVKKHRVSLDTENGEFLVELEQSRVEEGVSYCKLSGIGARFAISEPEAPTTDQLQHIKTTLGQAEAAILSGNLETAAQYLDIPSFVDYYILGEYLKIVDIGFSSVFYFYQDGKLFVGPVWDADLAMGNASNTYASYQKNYYNAQTGQSYDRIYAAVQNPLWKQLLRIPAFSERVKQRYLELQPYLQSLYAPDGWVNRWRDGYWESFLSNYTEAGWIVSKQYAIFQLLPKSTYRENVEVLRNWLEKRNVWLCQYWGLQLPAVTGAGTSIPHYNVEFANHILHTYARAAVLLPVGEPEALTDVTQDGTTNVQDAIAVLQYYVEAAAGLTQESFSVWQQRIQ